MWNELSLKEKADVIKAAVKLGIRDMSTIRNTYNEYAEGGKMPSAPRIELLQEPQLSKDLPLTTMPTESKEEHLQKLNYNVLARERVETEEWLKNNKGNERYRAYNNMLNTEQPVVPWIPVREQYLKDTIKDNYESALQFNTEELPIWQYAYENNLYPGQTCLNTVTNAYGERHAYNPDFAKNYKKYGYDIIPIEDMQPGDIVQLADAEVGAHHAMMATSTFNPSTKSFKTSQSHGGVVNDIQHGKRYTIDKSKKTKMLNYLNPETDAVTVYRRVKTYSEGGDLGDPPMKQDTFQSLINPSSRPLYTFLI